MGTAQIAQREKTTSHKNCEVKPTEARLTIGWETKLKFSEWLYSLRKN